jgi:meso-butanediol dehydrogenase / (S,S)-butanediol dehydrogenase / diacetyl reductase
MTLSDSSVPTPVSSRRFEGKVALITGAGHGIGRASAQRFAAEGAIVTIVDIDATTAGETADAIRTAGSTAHAIAADVADPDAVESMTKEALARFGRIDVLHNNAGRLRPGSVTDLAVDEWDRTFAVNIRSMFLVCRTIIPTMCAQGGGVIVNTASTSGLVGEATTPAYNASKAAIINFTRQLVADYSRSGIRANCVCPGWVPTGFNDPVLAGMSNEDVTQMVRATVPLGRQARTDEIAAAVAFLASDDASYIAGHALVVDGGQIACR